MAALPPKPYPIASLVAGDAAILRHYHTCPSLVLHPASATNAFEGRPMLLRSPRAGSNHFYWSRKLLAAQDTLPMRSSQPVLGNVLCLWAYPRGGIACVGISSVSLAYIAESERRPFDRLMSNTYTKGSTTSAHKKVQGTFCARLAAFASRKLKSEVSGVGGTDRNMISDSQPSKSIKFGDLQEVESLTEIERMWEGIIQSRSIMTMLDNILIACMQPLFLNVYPTSCLMMACVCAPGASRKGLE